MNIRVPENIYKYVKGKQYKIDKIGLSNNIVLVYDEYVLKISNQYEEYVRCINLEYWLSGKVKIPQIIECEKDGDECYILMKRVQGDMASSLQYLEHPIKLIDIIGEVLHNLWSIDLDGCPYSHNLNDYMQKLISGKELNHSMKKIMHLLKDIPIKGKEKYFIPDIFEGKNIFRIGKVDNQSVLSHGDFCLPNIIISNWKVTGLIDIGGFGISDKWRDIALCYRSLVRNYNGYYCGPKLREFQSSWLFDGLGIKPDWEKIAYWLLIDELIDNNIL